MKCPAEPGNSAAPSPWALCPPPISQESDSQLFVCIEAEHDKLASLSKTELEWERVRSNGPGYNTATHGSKPGASLYDQLKAREEESAMQEEEQQKGLGLPKAMDEDGTIISASPLSSGEHCF